MGFSNVCIISLLKSSLNAQMTALTRIPYYSLRGELVAISFKSIPILTFFDPFKPLKWAKPRDKTKEKYPQKILPPEKARN